MKTYSHPPRLRRADASPTRGQAGFTLIEAIVVIVVTGIVAVMVAVFISGTMTGYQEAEQRAEWTDAADVSLRRLARDVRLALPNSLRIRDTSTSGTCSAGTCYIEIIPTSDGGRYRDAADGSTGGDFLSFNDATDKTFDVLGAMPAMAQGATSGDDLVVYNLGSGNAPADAYTGGNRVRVMSVSGNNVTLQTNKFAAQSPPLPSPNNRFQVVPNSGPVTYSCPINTGGATPGKVLRYSGYGYNASQVTSFSVTPVVVADNAL